MQLLARIKAAFTSERWLQSSMRVLTGGSDSARQPFSYSQAVLYYRSWIYAAANLNAMAVASQPLRLYVRNRSTGTKLWKTRSTSHRTKAYFAGDTSELPSRYVMQKAAEYGDDYEVVTDNHPLLELLSKVNPYQNGFDATVLRVLYQELTGNAYIHPVIDKRTGIPSELWTMPSQYVEIIPGKSTLVDGYLYGASRETRKVFAADEVIHFKRPNPSDILYGMGKVEAAWGAAMMNAAMHEMDLSFFENKARPDYLMTIKTNASREEIERLEVQIDEKLRGKGRTGRFLTATADIDLKPMNFPPKDLGGREDIVEEIAAIFGVPVSMLKANDPNLASATVGFQSWKAISVLPLMRMDEETLNQNLVPLFGIEGDAFLAYDSPVVEDERFAFERRRSSVSAGVMTANEMRSREGLDVIDDPMADRLLINGQPLGGVPPMAAPMSFNSLRDEQVEPVSTPDELVDELPVTEILSPATKALTDIETRPPQTVADNARRALDIRAQKPESQRGMTAVGIARARDLANRVSLSEDTIRRMLAYFERHEVDKQGETWDEQGKGWQAWNGWGGDDGFVWARRKVEQFNREREQKAARKSCECCAPSDNASSVSHKSLWEDRFSIAGIRTKATANDAAREFDDINDAEKEIADRVSKSLEQQVAAVIAKIRAAPAPTQALADEVEKVLRSAKYSRQIVNALRPYLANALESGVTLGLDTVTKMVAASGASGDPSDPEVPDLGVTFAPARDDLRAYAQSESVRLARGAAEGIGKYTRVRVSKILGDGIAAGETIDQLANRVQEWAGEAGDEERSTRNRAVMIARTEAQRATRRAEVEAWKSTGMVEGKTWLLAPDPCEFCEAASNEFSTKSIGLEDSFFNKGDTMLGADGNEMALDYEDIDGPPLHPNCRCSLQPKLEPFLEDQAQQAEEDVDAYFDELTARAAKEKK
jgi:HK97 family phage portal protein